MADEHIPESSHSVKHKLRSSLCFSCCFGNNHHQVRPTLVRSSSQNPKIRRVPPHLKEKCHSFISRFGRHGRRYSSDFHYDALSYSLNFEDDANDDRHLDEEYAYVRSFSARLPQSPSPRASSASVTMREITAVG